MKQKRISSFLLSILLLLSFILTSCSPKSVSANADTDFENFTLSLFQQDVASTTIGLHYTLQNPEKYGISGAPVTYGTFPTDNRAALAALENCKAALETFSYRSLSEKNQLTYDILNSHLDTALEGAAFTLYEEPLSPVIGIQAQLPVLLAEYQFFSEEDVRTYLELLAVTPDYFHSLIQFEQTKSAAGLFMADYTADSILDQCNAFISMGENNYLLSTFKERLQNLDNLSPEKMESYLIENEKLVKESVVPAYESLAKALTELKGTGKNTGGLRGLPEGKEFYSHLVSRSTGSSKSVKELQKLIHSQIAADLADMNSVIKKNPSIVKKVSVQIDNQPVSIIHSLESDITDAFPKPAPVTTHIKYVPEALEPYLSPAFYMIPSIDNTSENVIYINRAHTMENVRLYTTLAHEGYPGHLYQTTYFASKNPDPVRSILNFSGYVEGWATYAEMCSYYLGAMEKEQAYLLQKNASIILGLYAAADIGIHYDGWDLGKTAQFFASYGITDENAASEIYKLIIADPANYLKYYGGYLELLELKKKMAKKEGADFSHKEFHKKILDIGPAPFDIVEKWTFK